MTKEMTEMGPRRVLGDVLVARMHQSFTMEADYMYEAGFLSQNERISLSNAVGQALDAFNAAVTGEVFHRHLDPPYIDMDDMLTSQEMSLPARLVKAISKRLFKPKSTVPENTLSVFKDKDGQWWMIGIYSNRFEDREGDILSEASHLEYAKWFQDSGIKPVVTLLHYPRMPEQFWVKVWQKYQNDMPMLNKIISTVYSDFGIAEAVRVTPLNGFTAVLSKVFPGKEQIAQNLAAMSERLGMSHGFISLKKVGNIIESYRTFEFTDLPKERAANLYTQPFFTEVKDMPVPKADRDFFQAVGIPEEVLNGLDSSTAKAFEQLAPILNYKDYLQTEGAPPMSNIEGKTPEPTPHEEVIPTPVVGTPEGTVAGSYEEMRDQLMKDFNLPGLSVMLAEMQKKIDDQAAVITTLQKQVTESDQTVKSLQVDEDQKIAAQFAPINWGMVGHSATKDDSNVIPNAEELKKQAPGQGVPSGNPLQDMLWGPVLAAPAPSNSK